MQALVNRGGQSIRVWNATWFPPEGNGAPAEGDWHDAMPNEIHLWGNLTDGELLRTARHETTHYMRRDSFDNGDFGSGDPSGYNPDDPSTESPRDCRRLPELRGWEYDKAQAVFS